MEQGIPNRQVQQARQGACQRGASSTANHCHCWQSSSGRGEELSCKLSPQLNALQCDSRQLGWCRLHEQQASSGDGGGHPAFLVHPHLASLCDEEAPVRIINWCTACTKRENMPLLCKIDKSSSKRSSTTWWSSSSSIRCQTLQVHQIPTDEKLESRFFGGNAPDSGGEPLSLVVGLLTTCTRECAAVKTGRKSYW